MKLLDNMIVRSKAFRNAVERNSFRMYKAAMDSRLVSDFMATTATINLEIRTSLQKVRSRARNLWKNNDYVRSYSRRIQANIVGSEGFSFQNRAMDAKGLEDAYANRIIEDKWNEWCKRQFCTMSGQLTFVRACWLLIQHFKRDGEFLVRKITGKNVNKFGFSLELISPDMLDENYNIILQNGNTVINGVERDDWKKPVAYWMKKKNKQFELMGVYPNYDLIRMPAEEIIHVFDPEEIDQTRGMSSLAQGMISLHMLDGWENASVTNARASAEKMGFLEYDPGTMAPDGYKGDDVDKDGNIIQDFTPGSIEQLPKGWKFNGWDPQFPHQQHLPFVKSMLRKFAAGLGLAYNTLANDLEGVNFSSMRSGMNDERDNWMMDQTLLIDGFLIPVFEDWLKWSLLTGEINLPYSKYDKFNQPNFMGRRWPWVDPEKDVDAAIKEISFGLSSRKRALQKAGYDWRDVMDENKIEQDYAKGLGLEFNVVGKGSPMPGSSEAPNAVHASAPAKTREDNSGDILKIINLNK